MSAESARRIVFSHLVNESEATASAASELIDAIYTLRFCEAHTEWTRSDASVTNRQVLEQFCAELAAEEDDLVALFTAAGTDTDPEAVWDDLQSGGRGASTLVKAISAYSARTRLAQSLQNRGVPSQRIESTVARVYPDGEVSRIRAQMRNERLTRTQVDHGRRQLEESRRQLEESRRQLEESRGFPSPQPTTPPPRTVRDDVDSARDAFSRRIGERLADGVVVAGLVGVGGLASVGAQLAQLLNEVSVEGDGEDNHEPPEDPFV